MIENKTCFIIPFKRSTKDDYCVHLFLESSIKYNMSKYLVFIVDSEEESDYLKDIDKDIITIIANKKITQSNCNVPSIKKFYGLEQLYKDYDYMATIDCDTLFLKQFNPYDIFKEIWETKSCFYKARTIDLIPHKRLLRCACRLGLDNNLLLRKETDNFNYNIWFSDITVYKSDNLERFFNWIYSTYLKDNTSIYDNLLVDSVNFDYYVYWYWLICYEGLTSDSSFLYTKDISLLERTYEYYNECINTLKDSNGGNDLYANRWKKPYINELLNKILYIEKSIGTHWTARNYEKTKDLIPNDRLCMQIHTDRICDYFI